MRPNHTMTISANSTLSSIRGEFTNLYPFLKLEFFTYPHSVHSGSPKKDLLKEDLILKPTKKSTGNRIIVHDNMPVAELEQLFYAIFGVSAQVFRKSGRSWLETSMTDDWTLRRQNDEGKELSSIA